MRATGWRGVAIAFACVGTLGSPPQSRSQTPARPRAAAVPAARRLPTPLEKSVLEALAVNPATAPYAIKTDIRDGKLVLSGRVATHAVHELVVQTALAYTAQVGDELVIDTGETGRALAPPASARPSEAPGAEGGASGVGWFPGATAYASPPYYYPPPLFGRLDEPFYGFEPPILSYPPWWPWLSRQRLIETARAFEPIEAPRAEAAPFAPPANSVARTVELEVSDEGVATLSGVVANERERALIEEQMRQAAGITDVVNKLTIEQAPQDRAAPAPVPPPPRPGLPARPAPPVPVDSAGVPHVEESVRLEVRDGVAYLEGRVAGALDAMRVFRAAQTAPGVRSVVDRLEFEVPSDRVANPLVDSPDRGEVEAYLLAQIQRQMGDAVTIDGVNRDGRRLEVRGVAADFAAVARAEAVMRSMPLLRGFELVPRITAR